MTPIGLIAVATAALLGIVAAAHAADKADAAAPAAVERSVDKSSPILMMTGRVTQVDANAKTFTITANGRQKTFVVNNFKSLPRPGEVVDVTYAAGAGGTLRATTVKGSKSNTSE